MNRIFQLWLGTLSVAFSCVGAPAESGPVAAPTNRLPYMVVVTGEELLRGVYADGHTVFLTRTLHPFGCQCGGAMLVDDNREDLKQALRIATQKAALVIVTGGLGPTPNDITREALSEFTGIPLAEHPDVLAAMERRFGTPRDRLRANLRRQTRVPTRGTYLANANGSAVGLVFEAKPAVIVALPGPPRELQTMVTNELVPFLQRRFGVRAPGSSVTLRFVGVGQSQIDQTIQDHVPMPPDVIVSSLFEGSRVDYTFALPGNTPQDQARLKDLAAKVRARLEEYWYADDGSSLEDRVARLLQARGGPLALVEVGSGGNLAASLSSAQGASLLLAGALTAPSEEKLRSLLRIPEAQWTAWEPGAERLQGLATAASQLTGSQWTIAVGEVQSGGGAAPHVWVVWRGPDNPWDLLRLSVPAAGKLAPEQLTTQILDRLRRRLK